MRLVPDLAGRLPGRGFWVAADPVSLAMAIRKRAFDRQAGGSVIVPDDLVALLERLLAQRCLDAVGLARRAGELVMGFDQVASVRASGERGLLIEASDAAEHGRRKLRSKQGDGPVVGSLSRLELGRALGREAVVHAWMRNGRLATRLLDDAAKLKGFAPVTRNG
jgi:ribosomal protein L7Ae-like RNA K-turn-binding protein